MHYGGLGLLGLEYFALKLPLIVTQLLPIACLAGVLLGFALLNRIRRGARLPATRHQPDRDDDAGPAGRRVDFGFRFSVSETVVPAATREAKYIYAVELKKRELRAVFANRHIWVRVRDGFLSVDSYDKKEERSPASRSTNSTATFGLQDLQHATSARMERPRMGRGRTELDADCQTAATVTKTGTNRLELGLTPADFGLLRLEPEEFSLWELNRYIADLRSKGLDPGGYVVDRDLKYAMPLSCLIMVALGMALSLDPLPRNLSLGPQLRTRDRHRLRLLDSLGITSSLGHSGLMPASVAAWLPNFMFSMIAISIFLFGEER